ncbi:Fic/DOC family protein [Nocardia sp. alder85J]|uniref:Fic/DOC family protein n=1 Tax=Nocardia sp. alder85J TaxID=2862949 RepID=UPI001CD785BF|nr:Fic family protein [Nocardia sp. alder85J]MCX4094468.1 Fic family protein [Nocardia sp. alder85J]
MTAGDDGEPMMRNLVGATTEYILRLVEYRQTMQRTLEIRLGSAAIPQSRDVGQWKAIHAHLFHGIYEWAGQFRTIDMGKHDVDFCPRHYLDAYARQAVEAVASRPWADLDREEFRNAAAHGLAALNAAHPFPEGNGRSTRLFFDQLTDAAQWTIDYSAVSSARWNDASRATLVWASPNTDPHPLRTLLDGMIEAKTENAQVDETMPDLMRRVLAMTTKMPHLIAPGQLAPGTLSDTDTLIGLIGDPTQHRSPEPPETQLE